MPYIAAWDEFARAAEKLYLSDPLKCRCVTKYRHADGKLVMKVTKPLLLQGEHSQMQKIIKFLWLDASSS